MEWSDTAVVLHVGRFRETDMWLRLLSRHRGIFNVFAFGGSRSRRRFCGCLDLLNTVNYRVKSSRNGEFLALQEGVLLRGPQRLRSDWSRLGMAMNCVRFLDALGVARDGAPAAFGLLESTLQCLEDDQAPHSLFPLFFRLRLASDQGFAPAFDQCGFCGREVLGEDVTFLMDEGQIRCRHCDQRDMEHDSGSNAGPMHGPNDSQHDSQHSGHEDQWSSRQRRSWGSAGLRYAVALPPAALGSLRHVQREEPAQWGGAQLSLPERRACARAIDGFVQYHLGIAWEAGRFRRV